MNTQADIRSFTFRACPPNLKRLSMLSLMLSVLLMVGCGKEEFDDSLNGSLGNSSGGDVSVSTVQAMSEHVLKVGFDGPPGEAETNAENYTVIQEDGQAVDVISVKALPDNRSVLVGVASADDANDTGANLFTVFNTKSTNKKLVYTSESGDSTTTSFEASNLDEPQVLSVVAQTLTRLKVVYSEAMGRTALQNNSYELYLEGDQDAQFQITEATYGDSNAEVFLDVQNLPVDADLRLSTTLVQNTQEVFTDPNGNAVLFTTDFSAPKLLSARVLSATQIELQFSKRMGDAAANPGNYTVSNGVEVTGAVKLDDESKVLLTLAPEGVLDARYEVTAKPVLLDKRGVALNVGARAVAFDGGTVDGIERPRLVAASSASNTAVRVTFSKPMGDSATDTSNYTIVHENINSEVGAVRITGAGFLPNTGRTIVELTTLSQNEVTYRLKVSGARDLNGLTLASQERLLDPTSVLFAGSGPGGSRPGEDGDSAREDIAPIDSDGDGIPDNIEQGGYIVIVQQPNGTFEEIQVTSDPNDADTDNDGLTDDLERLYGANPRNADTDGDTLSDTLELNTIFSSPYAVDTDGDGLEDGFEHFDLKTSPILADTDGDQLSDDQELFELNRNPLIADLPDFSIEVGDVRLQIDERYSYTDENGEVITNESSTVSTLARSDSNAFASSNSGLNEDVGFFEVRLGIGTPAFFGGTQEKEIGPAGGVEPTAGAQFTRSTSWTVESGSAEEAQSAFERSLAKARELTTNSVVTREIVSARLDVDLVIKNVGDVPFRIRDLEITVLQPNPFDTRGFVPVATLLSSSELLSGNSFEANLGPLNPTVGPILFGNSDIFPNMVEQLMKNPRGLVFRVANYNITDEFGRNFAFANQTVKDRTLELIIDYGDAAAAESHFIAASGALDRNDEYQGGFNGAGQPIKLPLEYVLDERFGLPRHDNKKDYIPVASCDGLLIEATDKCGESPIDPEKQAVLPDADGFLQTSPADVGAAGTFNTELASGIVAGANRIAETVAQGDDVQVIPVNTTGLSVGSIVIRPGDNGVLDSVPAAGDQVAFVSGYEVRTRCSVGAGNEGQFCTTHSQCAPEASVPGRVVSMCNGPKGLYRVGSLTSGDLNRGWFVYGANEEPVAADFDSIRVKGGDTLSIGFLQDLDKDGLFARTEFLLGSIDSVADRFDNSEFGIGFDFDTASNSVDGLPDSIDTDGDGIGDFAEVREGWLAGPDGGPLRRVFPSPFLKDSDGDGLEDLEERFVGDYFCTPSGNFAGYGFCDVAAESRPSLDPTQRDTDLDGLIDGEEVRGFSFGLAIIDGGNGIVDTVMAPSDVQKIPFNHPVGQPANDAIAAPVVGLPGFDGTMESIPGKDTLITVDFGGGVDTTLISCESEYLDPSPEAPVGATLVESIAHSRVDQNGTSDDEQENSYGDQCGSIASVRVAVFAGDNEEIETQVADDRIRLPMAGFTDPFRRDSDDDGLTDGLELTLGSNPVKFDSNQFRDDDKDGLSNDEERLYGWTISYRTVNGTQVDKQVTSNPQAADTDLDGLPDLIERELRTDPANVDTDGDGISDFDEVSDFPRFVRLLEPFSQFVQISGSESMAYGTDPLDFDTDDDGLSDFAELIECANIVLPGAFSPERICTSPVNPDTDLDGADDGQEVNRTVADGNDADAERDPAPTDPTDNDTDGDGNSDGAEIASGGDPLVPDSTARVVVRSVTTTGSCADGSDPPSIRDLAEFVWWFTVTAPSGETTLISDALDAEVFEFEGAGLGALLVRSNDNYYPIFGEFDFGNYLEIPAENVIPYRYAYNDPKLLDLLTRRVNSTGAEVDRLIAQARATIEDEGIEKPSNGGYTNPRGENIVLTDYLDGVILDDRIEVTTGDSGNFVLPFFNRRIADGEIQGSREELYGVIDTLPRGCFVMPGSAGRSQYLNLDRKSAPIQLREGESLQIRVMVAEIEEIPVAAGNCGLPPSFLPTNIATSSGYVLNKSVSYGDLRSGSVVFTARDGQVLKADPTGDGCDIDFELEVQSVGSN